MRNNGMVSISDSGYHGRDLPAHERLYGRRNSGNMPNITIGAAQQAKEKEEAELKECTFKPKINTNVKVPEDRSLL